MAIIKKGSYVQFGRGTVVQASNDGMKLLGYFLISQVGADTHFFNKWLTDSRNASISSSSYYLEKKDDRVYLSHLNDAHLSPFEATREQFFDIMKYWLDLCASDVNSVCGLEGIPLTLHRSDDRMIFRFER